MKPLINKAGDKILGSRVTKVSKFQSTIVPLLTEAGFKPNNVWDGDKAYQKVYQFEVRLPLGVVVQYSIDSGKIEVYAKVPGNMMKMIGDRETTIDNVNNLVKLDIRFY